MNVVFACMVLLLTISLCITTTSDQQLNFMDSNDRIDISIDELQIFHNMLALDTIQASIAYRPFHKKFTAADVVSEILPMNPFTMLDTTGNWDRLRKKVSKKILKNHPSVKPSINLMIVGSSACAGKGCISSSHLELNMTESHYEMISSWCSWTRRFSHLFLAGLRTINNNTALSVRICCSPGTSSNTGIQILKDEDYNSFRCGNIIDYENGIFSSHNYHHRSSNNYDSSSDLPIELATTAAATTTAAAGRAGACPGAACGSVEAAGRSPSRAGQP